MVRLALNSFDPFSYIFKNICGTTFGEIVTVKTNLG